MDPAQRQLMTPDVHAAVARTVGVSASALRTIGGFESFVYETELCGASTIVKATWSGRRTREHIGAEQHFLRYLGERGAPVCAALPLGGDEWIGAVPVEGGELLICAFEKAPGAMLEPNQWDDATLERWGELVGQLHRLAAEYPGPPPPMCRPTWQAEHAKIEALLADEPDAHRSLQRILREIEALPRDHGTYGTMHTDLHAGNLFWHAGKPRAFDFDDLLDFWFVSDLAIVLYYGLRTPPWTPNDRQADFERMRAALLRGYAREHELPAWCHAALPLFLDLREHLLWAVLSRTVPESERPERMRAYVLSAAERIRAGRPALDLVV
jgi:amicoumacin kinase